jgi:nuclear transport factor 2 (NTF2) superfamily protein
VEAWEDGWARHDPDVITARYAPDCTFRSHPFRPAAQGRDEAGAWIREAFAGERSARFAFGEPIVSPDARAAVEYRAVIKATNGTESTLAGTTVLRFDDTGLVVDHRDYWAIIDGDSGLAPLEEAAS